MHFVTTSDKGFTAWKGFEQRKRPSVDVPPPSSQKGNRTAQQKSTPIAPIPFLLSKAIYLHFQCRTLTDAAREMFLRKRTDATVKAGTMHSEEAKAEQSHENDSIPSCEPVCPFPYCKKSKHQKRESLQQQKIDFNKAGASRG